MNANILLFSDPTIDPVSTIRQLARHANQSATLHAFLRITASALRTGLAKATSPSRKRYPSFDTVLDLAEWYAALHEPEIVVLPVLMCIAQVGVLFRVFDDNPDIVTVSDSRHLYCLGLCNGMVAAAALAVCKTSAELLVAGPELVCLNMRLLLVLVDRSTAIEDAAGAWTVLTPGLTAKDHEAWIADFLKSEENMSIVRQPYISAESDAASTISGPPSSLRKYFSSCQALQKAKKIETRINTACHAPHLRFHNLNLVLGDTPWWSNFSVRKGVKVSSLRMGKPIEITDFKTLLLQCIDEILHARFCWGTMLHQLREGLKRSCERVRIYAIGPDRVSGTVEKVLQDAGLEAAISQLSSPTAKCSLPDVDDIAIVGVASRMPGGGQGLDEIWQLLKEGRDTHSKIPTDRFDLDDHYDATGKQPNTTSAAFGCFIDNPGAFDARMFNMSPREANQTDPGQRLALLTTYEALEMAGYSPNTLPSFCSGRIATFFGQTTDDYRDTNASQSVDIYYVSGGVRAFGPGRLNYHFKWEGPSMSVDTACSSSALSVQLAFQSLRSGECDMAVAGGMNIIIDPDMYSGLAKGGFLSKTGQCKTFDDAADGYCRGDGVGCVVMKRLQDAVAERDNVLAVIKSTATNHSAFAESITRPEIGAQVKVMRRVLRDAGIEAQGVDYVEMHGTGTQAGDATEFSSVSQVFSSRQREQSPLYIGSVKANVGHGEAAAGINSLVKVLLMLRHNSIPPHIGIKDTLNSRFSESDLANISINRELTAFPKELKRPRRIMLNSFNAAGGNTAMLIEDPPPFVRTGSDRRSFHVVAVSGRTKEAFCRNRQNLLRFLRDEQRLELRDIAYTTTARRIQHELRTLYMVQNVSELVKMLARDTEIGKLPLKRSATHKIIFTFTGQGSHHFDTARLLLHTSPIFKDKLMMYDDMCRMQGLPSFMPLLSEKPPELVTQAQFQLSIVAIQMALVATLEAWGVVPDAVTGHSIGEYAALAAAGVLTGMDVLHIVGNRGLFIDKLCRPGEYSMLSASIDSCRLEKIFSDMAPHQCVIACYNGPSLVVSGPKTDISRLGELLRTTDVPNKLLAVTHGFHSPQMHEVCQNMNPLCAKIRFNKPRLPVASTLLGKVVNTEHVFDDNYLVSQTAEPVQFDRALKDIATYFGPETQLTWLEIGTHPTCGPLIASTLQASPDQLLYLLKRQEDPWRSISRTIANIFEKGSNFSWAEYHKEYLSALSVIDLPRYSFDLQNYWIPYQNSWKLNKSQSRLNTAPTVPKIDPRLAPFHYLIRDECENGNSKLQLACDLSEPKILAMIRGHLVEGAGLCPSSVYAHLAFHAAGYILQKQPSQSPRCSRADLQDMAIISPLKLTSKVSPPNLLITAVRDSIEPEVVRVEFTTNDDSREITHCRCVLRSTDPAQWRSVWREHEYLIQSRVDLLKHSNNHSVHTLYREMMYRLFSLAIVEYSNEYQICNRISIDYEQNECLAELKIPAEVDNVFGSPGPFCLDALMHTAGFVLNSSPKFSHDTVFIASGWSTLRLAEPLDAGKTYLCHTRMALGDEPGVFCGNVNIILGNQIVGTCGKLKFHQLRRTSLQKLLGVSQGNEHAPKLSKPPAEQPTKRAPARIPSTLNSKTSETSKHVDVHSHIASVVEDIASQTGIPVAELDDDTLLSTLGIDSLLSISLLENIKERTGKEFPVNTFTANSTIKQLKEFLVSKLQPASSQSHVNGSEKPSNRELLSVEAPEARLGDVAQARPAEGSRSKIMFDIIASEVGMTTSEVRAASTVSELGMDSILTVSIIREYQVQTGEDLSARFFTDNLTPASIIQRLDGATAAPSDATSDSTDTSFDSSDLSEPDTPATSFDTLPVVPESCVSMLIQGKANSADPALFFLPDGSGSLFSYVHIPELRPGLPVYALDSPFHKNPEDFRISFATVAEIYVREIRRLQAHGPYMIAGWSLGGVHAYEVTRQLLEAGETVSRLIMIDSPCPGTLPPLPHASLDLLEKAGIFQALNATVGKVAQHTREHFVRITDAFQHWDYRPLNTSERQRLGTASIIWARSGVLEHDEQAQNEATPGMDKTDADMLKAKQWLTGKRPDFGHGGWQNLVHKKMQTFRMDGNHFSMMFPPRVSGLADILRKIL